MAVRALSLSFVHLINHEHYMTFEIQILQHKILKAARVFQQNNFACEIGKKTKFHCITRVISNKFLMSQSRYFCRTEVKTA